MTISITAFSTLAGSQTLGQGCKSPQTYKMMGFLQFMVLSIREYG